MGKVWITCKQCGKEKEVIKTAKDCIPQFCSKKCSNLYQTGKPSKKINWTKKHDELIRFAYNNFKTPTKALDYLKNNELFKNLKRATISRRARKLDVARVRKPNNKLKKEEIDIIEKYVGYKSLKAIEKILKKKGFDRTWRTIKYYCTKNRYSYKQDTYSLEEVREVFGFPPRKLMLEWIEKKLLICSGKKSGKYIIKPIAIAKFLREHPFELIRYKVDLPFIVALLDEFRPHQTKVWKSVKHENNFQKNDSTQFQEY